MYNFRQLDRSGCAWISSLKITIPLSGSADPLQRFCTDIFYHKPVFITRTLMMFSQLKPIAICQHHATQGPAYLQSYLDLCQMPYQIFAIHQGEAPPISSKDYSGIVLLGSNASVNDSDSWIRQEEKLLQDALTRHRPVLGHCFGGQLLAKVLGAQVRPNAIPQIGWDPVWVTAFPEAKQWLGEQQELNLFHWHYETFQIPRGAKRLLFGRYCLNKAFCYGPHLGLQSHLEVTAESVKAWCQQDRPALLKHRHLHSVQQDADILLHLPAKVAALHNAANYTYQQWLQQVPGYQLCRHQAAHLAC
jgi:GMP synthase-like glutamine amidotransferase